MTHPPYASQQRSPRRRWSMFVLALGMLSLALHVPARAQDDSAIECAVCHQSWAEGYKDPAAILLGKVPAAADVGGEDNCLGCHDGSVGDSRRAVWLEHGHRRGMAPPAGMTVPERLPLVNGKIECRTCHSAHGGSSEKSLAGAFFLRIANDEGTLCISCHNGFDSGLPGGHHPQGKLSTKPDPSLLAAGAHIGSGDKAMSCQTCHSPHGTTYDSLLVQSASDNTLCRSCHDKPTPAVWMAEQQQRYVPKRAVAASLGSATHAAGGHGANDPHAALFFSSDAQRAATLGMGAKVGDDDRLICLSCHKMHQSPVNKPTLLAASLDGGAFCIACHAEKRPLLGTPHDLRKSAPEAKNRFEQTAEQAGVCGACHQFHESTRVGQPSAADPAGMCVTCHQKGDCAEERTGMPFRHPLAFEGPDADQWATQLFLAADADNDSTARLACLTCHDPHNPGPSHFLIQEPDATCSTCHVEQSGVHRGAHDLRDHPELVNAKGQSPKDGYNCTFCHSVHDSQEMALWVGSDKPLKSIDDTCKTCHGADGVIPAPTLVHPSGRGTANLASAANSGLPLYHPLTGRTSPTGEIACATCHMVHADSKAPGASLRGVAASKLPANHAALHGDGVAGAVLCEACHVDQATVRRSMHGRRFVTAAMGSEAGTATQTDREHALIGECSTCHGPHDTPGQRHVLSKVPTADGVRMAAEAACLDCHASGTGLGNKKVADMPHPIDDLQNTEFVGEAGFMPLLTTDGRLGASGRITCQTCHLPHGKKLDRVHVGSEEGETTESAAMLRAARNMVADYLAPNLCSSCHGADGLRRYLYFHDPERRGGPTEATGP